MAARHKSRERALQVLYQWDVTKQPVKNAIDAFYDTLYSEETPDRPGRDQFMEELATGASANSADLDRMIEQNSQNWRLERMPMVDRNILRLAVFEMTRSSTPPAVVIDEALELAREYSGEESVGFINGVLDAVNKEPKN
jgi:N utilization substance protein B